MKQAFYRHDLQEDIGLLTSLLRMSCSPLQVQLIWDKKTGCAAAQPVYEESQVFRLGGLSRQ
jgi:hypothetical protein